MIKGEGDNDFYRIDDMKVVILTVKKPERKTVYATSSGLYF